MAFSMERMKKCYKCQKMKPESAFSMRRTFERQGMCKACHKAYYDERKPPPRPRYKSTIRLNTSVPVYYKRCIKCKCVLSSMYFSNRKNSLQSCCKKCSSEYSKEWRNRKKNKWLT